MVHSYIFCNCRLFYCFILITNNILTYNMDNEENNLAILCAEKSFTLIKRLFATTILLVSLIMCLLSHIDDG